MSAITVTITSDGRVLDESERVVSLGVTKEVNRIPSAEIRLADGDVAKQEFAISDSDLFDPGCTVDISIRDEDENDHSVFTGIAVRQSVEASRHGSYLTVQLKDPAVSLTGARRSAVFAGRSDGEIIEALVTDAGLEMGPVPATEPTHREIVQYRCTDWDFILSRADVNGLLVVADGGTVRASPIEPDRPAELTFEFGASPILDFELEFDAASQYERVETVGWDPAAQALTGGVTASTPDFSTGERDGALVAKQVGAGRCTLSNPVAMDLDELSAWAAARLARNRMALVRGRVSIPGQGDIAVLDPIEIGGIGRRFDGTTIVTGVAHRLDDEGWTTDVQFGLSPGWFCDEPGIDERPAGGLLPPVGGLQIGVVAAFEEDPSGELRVRVVVPGIEPDTGVVWARLAAPDAGAGRGWFFRPEPGDEVVLGFLNDDPRQAVILGSLFGSAHRPPDGMGVDGDNAAKGIVSRSGTTLAFGDGEQAVFGIETPAGNRIALDDAGGIGVSDRNGNQVVLEEGRVGIRSEGDLDISSAGDISIRSDGKVEIIGSKVDVG